jgi:hypothetical protein
MRVSVRRKYLLLGILLLAVGGPVVAFFVVNRIQSLQVQRAAHALRTTFPVGMSFSAAEKSLIVDYPRHTSYTTVDCEKWSRQTVPAYTSRGGPCIFGIVEVGGPRVMDAAVEFKLIFGPDDRLAQLITYPTYTFL